MDQTTKSDPAADLQADSDFRQQVRDWMTDHLRGEFAPLRFRGGPGDEHALVPERMAWERELAAGGWTCVGWPTEHGGRGLPLRQEVIFHEEYVPGVLRTERRLRPCQYPDPSRPRWR